MRKNIMKKLAKLEVKCGGNNFLALYEKTKKAFKIKHLTLSRNRYGTVEPLRKTCFSTVPYLLRDVNKNKYL